MADGQLRGEATRQRLIEAGLEVFGRYGFDGATTRQLAAEAGVNQAAIPYYFGGKEGLYVAVAEHLIATIIGRLDPVLSELERLADGGVLTKTAARQLLLSMLGRMAEVMIGTPEAEVWARFIVREQMDPTPAFDILYRGMGGRGLRLIARLLGWLIDLPEDDPQVSIKAFTLIGQILVFRAARAAVMRRLEWQAVGREEVAAVQAVVAANVNAILDAHERGAP